MVASKEDIAAHEAAHIVVGAALKLLVGAVSISDLGRYGDVERTIWPTEWAVVAVAGWVGEARYSGITLVRSQYYNQKPIGNREAADDHTALSDAVDILVVAKQYESREAAVEAAFEVAEAELTAHDAAWRALVRDLVRVETMEGSRVRNLLRDHGLNVLEPS